MNEYELKRIVEAVLFVSEKPMTVKEIWQKLFGPNADAKSGGAEKKTSKKASKRNEAAAQPSEQSAEESTEDSSEEKAKVVSAVAELAEPDAANPDEALDADSDNGAESEDQEELSTELFIDYGVSKDDVYQALCALQSDYEGRGCELKEVASGYRFQVNEDLAIWLQRWKAEKPPRYSRAVLETLAIIAYKQPITRAEIEDIRGVAVSSHIVKGLLEREWVRIVGHKEVPGRPALFATTKTFLDYFNVSSLEELPTLAEIKELGVRQPTDEADAAGGDAAEANSVSAEKAEAEGSDEQGSEAENSNATDTTASTVTEMAPDPASEPAADKTEPADAITELGAEADDVEPELAEVDDEADVSDTEAVLQNTVLQSNEVKGDDVAAADVNEALALSDDTLTTKSTDNAIKNTVECSDSDTVLENESTDSVNMDIQDAPILASSIAGGSVFEQADIEPEDAQATIDDDAEIATDSETNDELRANTDLPNATEKDAVVLTES